MRRAIDDAKIDRLLAIVVEAEQNANRANFLLKSKAENFDGSMVGFRPSSEANSASNSSCYDALRESSGSEGRLPLRSFRVNSIACQARRMIFVDC
jgi:hypothetical protein